MQGYCGDAIIPHSLLPLITNNIFRDEVPYSLGQSTAFCKFLLQNLVENCFSPKGVFEGLGLQIEAYGLGMGCPTGSKIVGVKYRSH